MTIQSSPEVTICSVAFRESASGHDANWVSQIAKAEDSQFLDETKATFERIDDRKLRKHNYRAWKAKHATRSQSTQ